MTKPSSDNKPRTSASELKAVGHWVDRHARYFLAAAVMGFVLTAVLHVSTFFITPANEAWELNFLFSLACIPVWAGVLVMLVRRNRFFGLREFLWARQREADRSNRRFWSGIYRNIPKRSGVLIYVLVIYVFLNFFASIALLGNESARIVKGHYVLESKGRVVREVPRDVWNAKSAQEFRLMSGHPMVFYALLMILFYYRPDEKYYREYLEWRKKQKAAGGGGKERPGR